MLHIIITYPQTQPEDGLQWLHLADRVQSEYKHSLTFRVPRYVVTAMKPMHRLQIHPTVHN